MYTITGKCGMTYIRISLKDMLQLLSMKDRLEDEGWTIEGPIHVPDFTPEGACALFGIAVGATL